MQIMTAKITTLRTLYAHVVSNSVMFPEILYDIFIAFFETFLGREHSGKVSKKFIGNFNLFLRNHLKNFLASSKKLN